MRSLYFCFIALAACSPVSPQILEPKGAAPSPNIGNPSVDAGTLSEAVDAEMTVGSISSAQVVEDMSPAADLRPAQHTIDGAPIPCDGTLALAPDGNWLIRYGDRFASSAEPPLHLCAGNSQAARIATSTSNAVILEWGAARPSTNLRQADVSFRVPSLTSWSHFASFPAYDRVGLGRIGAAAFSDKLFIQLNKSGGEGCNGVNLFNGVDIPGGLLAQRWYRVNAQVRLLVGGSLEVKAILLDLSTQQQIAHTEATLPASCTPAWYGGGDNRWAFGVLGTASSVATYVDDFQGRAE